MYKKSRFLEHLKVLALAVGLSFGASNAAQAADIKAAQIISTGGGCKAEFTVTGETPNRVMNLSSPPRMVFDFKIDKDFKGKISNTCTLVGNARYSRFNSDWFRFVLELKNKAGVSPAEIKGGKVSFNLVPGTNKSDIKKPVVTTPVQAAPLKQKKKTAQDINSIVEKQEQAGQAKKESVKQDVAEAEAAIKPKRNYRPIIVIDPGHGGIDPGAIGEDGVEEKNIVLAAAHALRQGLQQKGGYRVRMTRSSDVFTKLADRQNMARELEADLFISLHADAAPEDYARGLSIYTLSEQAAEKLGEQVKKSKNPGDFIDRVDLNGKSREVAGILFDLAQRESKSRSAQFASMVSTSMTARRVKLLNHTHRFAGFVVLKSPNVPAVLVELGFLSNKFDSTLLQSPAYRKKIADGLIEAIDKYFAKYPVE